MNLIVWLMVGGLIGWVAGNQIKLQRRRRRVMPKVITIAVVGALLGGLLLAPLLGSGRLIDSVTLSSFVVSMMGSLTFLRFVKRYHSVNW